MLPIAGQTAGPNGLKFLVWVFQSIKIQIFFKFSFHGQRRALQIVMAKYELLMARMNKIVRIKINYLPNISKKIKNEFLNKIINKK